MNLKTVCQSEVPRKWRNLQRISVNRTRSLDRYQQLLMTTETIHQTMEETVHLPPPLRRHLPPLRLRLHLPPLRRRRLHLLLQLFLQVKLTKSSKKARDLLLLISQLLLAVLCCPHIATSVLFNRFQEFERGQTGTRSNRNQTRIVRSCHRKRK